MWRRHSNLAVGVLSSRSSCRVAAAFWLAACAAILFLPAVATAAPQAPATDDGTTPRLTSPQPQQDTFTAADEAPGSRNVRVSFNENFISDRLPFDVPFNVTGSVETTVKRLELSVYRVPPTSISRSSSRLSRTP